MFNKFNKKKKFSKEDESALLNDILNDNLEDDIEEDYETDIDDTDDEIGLINDILEEDNKKKEDNEEDLSNDNLNNEKENKKQTDSEYYKEEYLKDKEKNNNNEDDEELEVLNINDIENIAGKRKKVSSKRSKNNKMYLLLIGIVVIIVGILILLMLLPNGEKVEIVDPSIKVEDTSNLVEDIVIEEKLSEITQYGEVKRILSNKIIIIPDNSESDTIYFINDKTKVDVETSLKIGDRIEYTYIIEEQNYIFINFKNVYSGIVKQKYDDKIIVQLDGKDYSEEDEIVLENTEIEEEILNEDKTEDTVEEKIEIDDNANDENIENETKDVITIIGDKFSYGMSLKTIAEQIENGDKIEFCLDDSKNITSISNIIKKNKDDNYETTPKYARKDKVEIITEGFNKDDFLEEYQIIDANKDINNFEFITETDFVNNSVKFYNSFVDPIWIRFAWRDNSYTNVETGTYTITNKMPSVNDVAISFITPSGKVISSENIDEFGRMWIDGNIVNFAIQHPEEGEWTLKADKNLGFYLGETNFHLMKLTGFITIDKFGINNHGNGLVEFIWNVGGVEDEYMEIEISLVGEKYSKTIYSASSKNSNLRNIDHCTVDISEVPKGVYTVVAKVKDLDIENYNPDSEMIEKYTRQVTAETIIHRKTVGQLEIN